MLLDGPPILRAWLNGSATLSGERRLTTHVHQVQLRKRFFRQLVPDRSQSGADHPLSRSRENSSRLRTTRSRISPEKSSGRALQARYIPIAKTSYVRDEELAQAFIDFLTGEEGRAVFRRWHYLADLEEARRFALPDTPVGGEWMLPEGW